LDARRGLPPFPTRRSSDLRLVAIDDRHLALERVRRDAFVAVVPALFVGDAVAEEHRRALEPAVAGEPQRVEVAPDAGREERVALDRKSTRLNSSHVKISYA